ncbi:hypothetical protein QOZ80_6BG0473710 [Eleusine coracana subsp. coracana]|nr:hypothetical protein QOZ80_6BG0473710 [Eleusine coracana subsp. coracana]
MDKTSMAKKKQQTVVLYPGPGVGHVTPMLHLTKVFLRHGYDVTMVLVEPPSESPDYRIIDVDSLAASNPAINFHSLPPVPDTGLAGSGKPPFLQTLLLLQRYNDELERFLRSIVPRHRLHSLVTGMFSTYAVDVATNLGVPVYTFFASAAAFLAVVTQLPEVLAGRQEGLKALGDAPIEFRGVPPIPASHLVKDVLEHPEEDELCKAEVDVWNRTVDTHGVLVNTFESLETRAVQALRDPHQCVVPGREMPPIYCVGPLIGGGHGTSAATDEAGVERHDECLAWLDAQPNRSVVFLCFGSRGTHSAEQIREIAVGLENSGQRFLWAVRRPPGINDSDNFDTLFPDGFLERTKHRGLVVESWAPQVDVLHHPATGAFVTHCGWNSTLEGVTAGVPMLCWPLYAEQMFNKVLMTQDMGVGVEEEYMGGFIKAEEVEAKVRLVMMEESEEGRQLRKRVAARKQQAKAALEGSGTSLTAFVRFLADSANLRDQLGK